MTDEEPTTDAPQNTEGDLRSTAHEMHALVMEVRQAVREMKSSVGRPALLIASAAFVMAAAGLYKVSVTQEVRIERPETESERFGRMTQAEMERLDREHRNAAEDIR